MIVAPSASAAKIGRCTWSGDATASASRASSSRDLGPGISVFSSMTRIAATVRAGYRSSRLAPSEALLYRRVVDDWLETLAADPIAQFQAWFDEARSAGLSEPDAAALASVSADGRPSVRMVLVRRVDERGFCFFTNRQSRKARELDGTGHAALVAVQSHSPMQHPAGKNPSGLQFFRPRRHIPVLRVGVGIGEVLAHFKPMLRSSITRKLAMTRWSIPEPLTHLYYSPVYATLTLPQRLAYNRLHLCYMCELYMLFEENFPRFYQRAAESAAVDERIRGQVAELAAAEARHAGWFRALAAQLSPELYANGGGPHFTRVPALAGRLMEKAFLRPRLFPALFWIVMVMEERAVYYANQVAAQAAAIDPQVVRVHEWHVADEAAHLDLDEALISLYWDGNHGWIRRLNGWLIEWVFRELLTTPKRGGIRLVRQWLRECPELAPRRAELEQEMRALGANSRFRASIYSPAIVPRSLERLARWPELRGLRAVLAGESAA